MGDESNEHWVHGRKGAGLGFVKVPRPASPPEYCGMSDQDGCCLGCAIHLGCIKNGKCYAVDGESAMEGTPDK